MPDPFDENIASSAAHISKSAKSMQQHTISMARAPVVAVLSTVKIGSSGLPIGKEAAIYKQKFAMAKQYGIIMYLFHAHDFEYDTRSIKGYTYLLSRDNLGSWARKTFPFPDVVYNRIRSRKVEKQPRVMQLLEYFESHPHVQFFNSRFLDKWDVYRTLLLDPVTAPLVPPSKLLSTQTLKELLDEHSEVFIKPRASNAGKGIIKVIQKPGHSYSYSRSESNAPRWKKGISYDRLCCRLQSLFQNHDNYIVQAGIDLGRVNGQVFDMRAQVQKDGHGQWVFTGISARIASQDRFITFPHGVKQASAQKILDLISRGSESFKKSIKSQLASIYYLVPTVLERDLGLSLAILSIDIGIDTYGKVWLIEVSSKSDSFEENKIRDRHFRLLMEYFLYINSRNKD